MTNKVQDVPTFLREVEAEFRGKGELKHVIRDIEGCFPNMPKDAIRLGLRDWAKRIQREWGHQGARRVGSQVQQGAAVHVEGRRPEACTSLAELRRIARDHGVLT